MGVAVDEPGQQRAAARVDDELAVRIVFERRDTPVAYGQRAGLEAELGALAAADVLEARARGAQHLGGAGERDRRRARGLRVRGLGAHRVSGSGSSIGMRSPPERAAASACG